MSKLKINRRKLMKSKKVQDAAHAKAVKVQKYWKSIAPVFGDKPPHRSAPSVGSPGDYQNSIVIKESGKGDGDLPGFRVTATDFKARWIEFGNAHMPAYAPLAKTKAKFR